MGILIIAMSKRRVSIRIVRVSLNLDDAIIKDRLNIQNISHLRFFVRQNLMFSKIQKFTVSFHWRIGFLIAVSALRNVFLVDFTCSFNTSISSYHFKLSSPYMQSNSDLFSTKIKQSILIHNANHQVRNAPCNDRKINDLCRCFRSFIS